MFARKLSLQLKPNSETLFTEKMKSGVLPLLRRQSGFKDEMTLVSQDGTRAIQFSLWDRRESAETYVRDTHPQVERLLAPMVEGSPKFGSYNVVHSTFHEVAATVPA